MSGQKLYYLPEKPADLNADDMTIQETAYVLKCSVGKLRKLFRDDKHCRFHSRHGRGIVTSIESRERIRRHFLDETRAKYRKRAKNTGRSRARATEPARSAA